MLPLLSTAMPVGHEKDASMPAPSLYPAVFPPARVVITPSGVIFLMALFPESETYRMPSRLAATDTGSFRRENSPVPSEKPALRPPARVVTTPPGAIFLIVWVLLSATYRTPLPSIAMPVG